MNKLKRSLTLIGVLVFALAALFALYPHPADTLEDLPGPTRVLVVTPDTATINVGGSQQYRAYVSTDGGDTLGEEVTDLCIWYSDDSVIAYTGSAKGSFTGGFRGATTVRATFEGTAVIEDLPALYGQARLVVNEAAYEESLVVEPDTATIYVGESQQYRAYHHKSDGTVEDVTDYCTWDINDPIATMTVQGRYKGVLAGSSRLTAFYPEYELSDDAELTVEVLNIRYWLEVEPKAATIQVSLTQQYRAYLHASIGNPVDVTDIADWSVDGPIAASIPGKNGLYLGIEAGTCKVTASVKAGSDDATLTVWVKDKPPIDDLPEGKIIDRQPGYITLGDPQKLGNPGVEFTMTYDNNSMDGNPDRYPKVFYWNDSYEKWVALSSYPLAPGVVKAKNDGNYSGWFVVFGCAQPRFTDITAEWNWAEPIANRMNGLGLLEGYPDPANPTALVRPAGLGRTVTRAELTAFTARILGLAPGDTQLYPTITYLSDVENNIILGINYSDDDEIAAWARPYIAAMTNKNLVNGKGVRFAPNDKMTRIEAAVLISNALKDVPGFGHPADLSGYTDADLIPAWAVGKVAEGTISGYPDGSLRPNTPINRAESMVLLLKLLRGLGW